MRVISLGWGVQSWAMAAMVALGELPPVDAAIHADTTHERSETYAFAHRWTPWLEARGVRVVTVRWPRAHVIENWSGSSVMLPVYTTYDDGTPSAMLRRQCTHDWKVLPIRRWLQANRNRQPVEQWIGITVDEVERARPSDVQYITNRWPLLEMGLRRSDVVRWLVAHDLEIPVKSSCIHCPYHDRVSWREIQRGGNGDWQKALMVDEAIRHKRPNYVCYLVAARKPLAECDFSNAEDHGQLALWSEECSGHCFL